MSRPSAHHDTVSRQNRGDQYVDGNPRLPSGTEEIACLPSQIRGWARLSGRQEPM